MNFKIKEVVEHLHSAITETFEKMLFSEVTNSQIRDKLPEWTDDSIVSSIEIFGPVQLNLRLYINQDHAIELTEMLYGTVDESKKDEILNDFVSESLNSIAGRFAISFTDDKQIVKLSVPMILEKHLLKETNCNSENSLNISFDVEEYQILCCVLPGTMLKEENPEENIFPSKNGGRYQGTSGQIFTILIVDDHKPTQQVLEELLINQGYKVRQAYCGEDALKNLNEKTPHLVLLDINMPGIDGFEVCEKIKKRKKTANVPVIFLTAKNDPGDKVKGFKSGGVDYISKPFHIPELISRLKTHIQISQNAQAMLSSKKRLEKILKEQTDNLVESEKQAVFGRLFQGMMHNLNNHLSGITGYAQLMKLDLDRIMDTLITNPHSTLSDNKLLLDNLSNRLSLNLDFIERLLDMINAFMSRSSKNQSEDFENVDLNEIITEEIEFLENNLLYKNKIDTKIVLAKGDLIVNVVTSYISQVFQNLVKNAIDAMHNVEKPKLNIETGRINGRAWFTVSDNGSGIQKNMRSRIFDPFFTTKAPNGRTEQKSAGSGTGLGLFMCKELLSILGGEIIIERSSKNGTTIKVNLPEYQ